MALSALLSDECSDIITCITDFLPLPTAMDVGVALENEYLLEKIVEEHHTRDMLDEALIIKQCCSPAEFPRMTIYKLGLLWDAWNIDFPWDKLLCVAAVYGNLDVVKYICASLDLMCSDVGPIKNLQENLVHNQTDVTDMLDSCGLDYLEPNLEFQSDVLRDCTAVPKVWRRLTKTLVRSGHLDPVSVMNEVCSAEQLSSNERLLQGGCSSDEWLHWVVDKFSDVCRKVPRTWSVQELGRLVRNLTTKNAAKTLRMVLMSSWATYLPQPALHMAMSIAVSHGYLECCAYLHQYGEVCPLDDEVQRAGSYEVRSYFKYALHPDTTSVAQDHRAKRAMMVERHEELLSELKMHEAEEHELMMERHKAQRDQLDARQLREVTVFHEQYRKRKHDQEYLHKQDNKRARVQFIRLSSLLHNI